MSRKPEAEASFVVNDPLLAAGLRCMFRRVRLLNVCTRMILVLIASASSSLARCRYVMTSESTGAVDFACVCPCFVRDRTQNSVTQRYVMVS